MNTVKDESDGNREPILKVGQAGTGYISPLEELNDVEADNDSHKRKGTPSAGGKWPCRKKETEEGKPYSKPPDNRRRYFEMHQDLPKELKEMFGPLKCVLCNCEMPSPITAKCHYSGKKHISNIKKWFTERPELLGKYKIPEYNKNASIDPEKLYCKYCDLTLSSEQQAEAHYAGKKHQDVINNKMMKNAFFNAGTGQWERCETAKEDKTGRFGIGLAFLKPDAGEPQSFLNPKPVESGHRFFCETCRIACPSQISLNDHFGGAKHKKKTAALTREVPPPGDEFTNEKSRNREKVPGPESETESKNFEFPIESGSGLRKERNGSSEAPDAGSKALPDCRSRGTKTRSKNSGASSRKYSCALCEKDFYGRDRLIEHLTSMSHEVLVAQNFFDYRFDRKTKETLDCSYCDFDAVEIDDAIVHFLSEPHENRLRTPDVAVDGTLVCPSAPGDGESAFPVRIAPKIIDATAFYFCSVCNLKIFGGKSNLLKHLKGFGHSAVLRDPGFEMKIYLDYGMNDSDVDE